MAEEQAPEFQASPSRDVFISYASQDAAVALDIAATLERNDVRCWIAPRDVTPGAHYADAIIVAISGAKIVVLLLSDHALSSKHVGKEVERASSKGRPIIALRTCAAPLPPAFEYFLSESQWIDVGVGGIAAVAATLIGAVRSHLDPAVVGQSHAPIPPTVSLAVSSVPRKRRVLAAIAAATLVAGGLVYLVSSGAWRSKPTAPTPSVAATTRATTPTPARISRKSIAVLPFENLTGRVEDAYLADGLQEEILNALARIRDLTVVSRTSTAEFRNSPHSVIDIGRRLGVGSILEGSIRREGNTLRLTIQLIDARDDRHLLAANYDRDLGHVLGLQSEVARVVAEALAATLSRSERGDLARVGTNSGDAYDCYLRAVALFRRPVPNDEVGLVEPKRLLEEALRLDPDYADALALLSQAYSWSFFLENGTADASRAKQAFDRALAIDPELPEAWLARGFYEMYVGKDLERATADFEAVVHARPSASAAHFALGLVLRRRSHFQEAIEHLTRAWDLDPLNHAYDGGALVTLLGLRRYPEAVELTKLEIERFPNEPDGYFTRAEIESQLLHSAEPLRGALREHGALFDPTDYKQMGARIAQMEGRYLDAVQLWNSARASDPVALGETIGFLYLAVDKVGEANRAFREAETEAKTRLRLKPDDTDLLEGLAVAQSMLGEHATALATINAARAKIPEAQDPVNGPRMSFARSVVLVRGGHTAEGYAEIERLVHVPFGVPISIGDPRPWSLLLKAESRFDVLMKNPPRL